jgi:short-subunit dehydrogenase
MSKRSGLEQNCAGIITGASSGIGKAMSLELARKYKASLIICARSADDLRKTKDEVEKLGGRAEIICGDLSENNDLPKRVADSCIQHFGKVNFLVNNAGLGKPGTFMKLTPADWEMVFRVNFFAPLYLTYEVMPHFLKQGSGKIVNVSSIAGKIAFPGSVCYASSKFALTGLSEGLATEVTQLGVDVLTVCPGWVRTEFFEKNKMSDLKNPTMIAEGHDFKAFLMRSVLSISSQEAALEIIKGMEKGGSHELVMTAPGVLAERLKAFFPGFVASISERAPLHMVDSSAVEK